MKNCSLPELEQASRAHHTMYSTYLNQTATVVDEKNKQSSKRPPYNRRIHLVEEQQASNVGGQQVQDQHLQSLDNNATPMMEDAMIGAVARSQPSQVKSEKSTDKNKQPFCVLCKKIGHATRHCRHRPAGAGENNTCYTPAEDLDTGQPTIIYQKSSIFRRAMVYVPTVEASGIRTVLVHPISSDILNISKRHRIFNRTAQQQHPAPN